LFRLKNKRVLKQQKKANMLKELTMTGTAFISLRNHICLTMNYPAAEQRGVSTVIPAPNQVRDKLQPESRNMLDWIPPDRGPGQAYQVRDDKTKQASGILVRRVYGGLVRRVYGGLVRRVYGGLFCRVYGGLFCLLPASGWFTSLWMVYQPLDGLPAFG